MLAGGPFGLGPLEIGIIVIVVILIFGVGKVADLGGALGKSVREFRKNVKDDEPQQPAPTSSASNNASTGVSQATAARFCSNCHTQLTGDEKFCVQCGTPTQATVT